MPTKRAREWYEFSAFYSDLVIQFHTGGRADVFLGAMPLSAARKTCLEFSAYRRALWKAAQADFSDTASRENYNLANQMWFSLDKTDTKGVVRVTCKLLPIVGIMEQLQNPGSSPVLDNLSQDPPQDPILKLAK